MVCSMPAHAVPSHHNEPSASLLATSIKPSAFEMMLGSAEIMLQPQCADRIRGFRGSTKRVS
jgi:hypothetical protein